MSPLGTSIRGLQAAQRAMLKVLTAVKPEGGLGRAVLYLATSAHRILVTNTHVDTGAYRASQYVKPEGSGRYRIYIAGNTNNPRTGASPAVYGPAEEARGGSHAAYQRTFDSGPELAARAAQYLIGELP